MSETYVRKQLNRAMEYAKKCSRERDGGLVTSADLLVIDALRRALDGLGSIKNRKTECERCKGLEKALREFNEDFNIAAARLNQAAELIEV